MGNFSNQDGVRRQFVGNLSYSAGGFELKSGDYCYDARRVAI